MPVSVPGENRRTGLVLWTAHHAVPLLVAGAAVNLAAILIPGPSVLGWLSLTGLIALEGSSIALYRHGLILCPLCAAELPLQASQEAARHATALRWCHYVSSRRGQTWQSLAMLVALAAWLIWTGPIAGIPLIGCLYLGNAALAHLHAVHHRFQPWCPHCDHGGRGDRTRPRPVTPIGVGVT